VAISFDVREGGTFLRVTHPIPVCAEFARSIEEVP
jgi:hypothetical protein